MSGGRFSACILLCALLLIRGSTAEAYWIADGAAISTAANEQSYPEIISDGSGGAIIAWQDHRSGAGADIYAQRVDASGNPLWAVDGIAISTAAGTQYPKIVSDGSGGAIITWHDYRSGTNYDIYAQRVDASGNPLWAADGIAISTAAGTQWYPKIVSDGSGGAVITWEDYRSGTKYDIYAQRVDASGNPLWTADGVAVSTAVVSSPTRSPAPIIASDGSGGAIITWEDYRNGTKYDIYAQRVDASGNPLWTAGGVPISTAANEQWYPRIVSDGSGGAIIAWYDGRSWPNPGYSYDIYAQRVDASGNPLWTADGIAISTAADDQWYPTIVSDGSGGAVIAWYDYRSGTNWDVYAQRVDASGNPLWTADGVAVSTAANDQWYPRVVSDGSGGAVITWIDHRSGSNDDTYAQRVDASGNPLWTANGVAICTAANDQWDPTIVSDGSGGAVITWYDYRSGAGADIYAQRVWADGGVPTGIGERPPALTFLTVLPNAPNPFSGATVFRIGLAKPSRVTVEVYDVSGRKVYSQLLPQQPAGWRGVRFEGQDDVGRSLPSGVYFYRVIAAGEKTTRKMVILR